MSRAKRILIAALIIFMIFAGIVVVYAINNRPEIQHINLTNANLTKDGTYVGECDNKLIKAIVKVKVEKGRIANIEILEHDNGLGSKAEAIINDVMREQSLNVNVISGATYSSSTILKAIENALQQGKKE